ncbi:uncharacterized protein LOC116930183 [Daphnia magna]|uniref:uncharacterized protein LOC116930183 n=1 Tax=Daphnia magna TaxID=35525 RepID=UPI001E1BDB8D|nr:uncharacterized protein LOC116930183 [Daphnia magna]
MGRNRKVDMDPIKRARIDKMLEQRKRIGIRETCNETTGELINDGVKQTTSETPEKVMNKDLFATLYHSSQIWISKVTFVCHGHPLQLWFHFAKITSSRIQQSFHTVI